MKAKAKNKNSKVNISDFTPQGNYMLVEFPFIYETDEGVILSEGSKKMKDYVEVIAKGPDCKQVEVGDYIILNGEGTGININGTDYALVKEFQILGHFPEEPKSIGGIQGGESDDSGTDNMKTEKTEKNIKKFNDKYGL